MSLNKLITPITIHKYPLPSEQTDSTQDKSTSILIPHTMSHQHSYFNNDTNEVLENSMSNQQQTESNKVKSIESVWLRQDRIRYGQQHQLKPSAAPKISMPRQQFRENSILKDQTFSFNMNDREIIQVDSDSLLASFQQTKPHINCSKELSTFMEGVKRQLVDLSTRIESIEKSNQELLNNHQTVAQSNLQHFSRIFEQQLEPSEIEHLWPQQAYKRNKKTINDNEEPRNAKVETLLKRLQIRIEAS